MTRTKYPASSYNNDLRDILREGAIREHRFTFNTPGEATTFTHRLNSYRNAMKMEKYPGWEELYRAGIRRDKKDKTTIIVAPRDSEFEYALKDFKANLTSTPEPSKGDTAPSVDPTDGVEDFLSDLRKKT